MEKKQIASNKQVKLEIEMILNRKLFQDKVIDRETYENVQDELLREIIREKEKVPKILVTCEGCGGKTYDTDINYCSDCGKPTCPNCDNYDIQEEKHYCNDCWSKKGSVK